jgi:hypothetical protein
MASSTDNFFASVCPHPPNQKLVRHLPWKEQPIVSYQPNPSGTAQLSSPPPLDLPHYGIGFIDAVKRGFNEVRDVHWSRQSQRVLVVDAVHLRHLPGARSGDLCRRHGDLA